MSPRPCTRPACDAKKKDSLPDLGQVRAQELVNFSEKPGACERVDGMLLAEYSFKRNAAL